MKPHRLFDSDSPFRLFTFPTGTKFFAASAIVLAIVLFGAAATVYGQVYVDKIFPGVSVVNANIGGNNEDAAKQIVGARLAALAKSELTFHYGDRNWTSSLQAFGLQYDLDGTVKDGYLFGRQGNIVDQLDNRLSALLGGHRVPASISFDRNAQQKTLAPMVASIDRPPVDAALDVTADGSITASPSQTRLQVDVDKTLKSFASSFKPFTTRQLDLVVRETPPDIVSSDLVKPRAAAQAIIGKPIVLKFENRSWTLDQDQLRRMLVFSRTNGQHDKLVAQLDRTMLADFLGKVASEIDLKPKDATLEYDNGEIVAVQGSDGQVLDSDAAIAAIEAHAVTDQRDVTLVLKKQGPDILPASLQEPKALAEKMIAEPLTLKYGDLTWTLSRQDLGEALVFPTEGTGHDSKVVPAFDKKALSGLLERVGNRIAKPARDARFTFHNGQLSLLSASVDGLALDVDATMAAIDVQTRLGNRVVDITTTTTTPKVQSSDKDNIVIKDLLKEASTSYAGSIPERAHNVELATARLNGVVIPPGAVFSIDDALGPVTTAAGYQIGYGITMSGTQMVTVPSEGGGICQVATTLYQAAFWAGLPIVNRLNHMYYISRYAQPPTGMKGMDATIDPPSLDMQFKNSTPNWLAIEANTDGEHVYFRIYGTKTGWQVKVDGPIITNVVPADRKMVYEEDPTIPWGRQVMVEEAEDGFTATIVRTVYQDGNQIDKYVAISSYRPSRNDTVIGTKGRPQPPPATNGQSGTKDQTGANNDQSGVNTTANNQPGKNP